MLEQLIRGKSTPIASRINTAVDTAVGMVERLLGRGAILRTGNQDVQAELAALASELAGGRSFQGAGEVWMDDSISDMPTLRAETGTRAVRRFHQAVEQLRRTAARVAHSDPAPLRRHQFLQRWRVARYERAWQTLLEAAERSQG